MQWWRLRSPAIRPLQAGDSGKPAVQRGLSLNTWDSGAGSACSDLGLKARDLGALMSKGRRRWTSQLKWREREFVLPLHFCSRQAYDLHAEQVLPPWHHFFYEKDFPSSCRNRSHGCFRIFSVSSAPTCPVSPTLIEEHLESRRNKSSCGTTCKGHSVYVSMWDGVWAGFEGEITE